MSDIGKAMVGETSVRDKFNPPALWLHWLTAALIAVQFITIWMHDASTDGAQAAALLLAHRSSGVCVWIATAARLIWRWLGGPLPKWPEDMPWWQRIAAKASEFGLYALLLLQPLTGFAQSIYRGKIFPLLFGEVPVMVARDKPLTALFHNIHAFTALALLALIALHTLAALFHHFVRRDGVLRSMLPW